MMSLAWKNIWRNGKRTILSVAAIVVAFLFSLLLRSMSEGSNGMIIDTAVRSMTGYLRVSNLRYAEAGSMDDLLVDSAEVAGALRSIPGVIRVLPRLEGYALAVTDSANRGVRLVGTPAVEEREYSGVDKDVVMGRWLADGDEGVVISEGLAEILSLGIGGEVDMIGQGYRGNSAVARYPVIGIVRFDNPQMDQSTVYLTIQEARRFAAADGLVSGWLVDIANPRSVDGVGAALRKRLDDTSLAALAMPPGEKGELVVRTWKQTMPELKRMMELMDESMSGLARALYVIVFFGVFGTILSMTLERRREFSILKALGMRAGTMNGLQATEGLMIAVLGIAVSTALGAAVVVPLSRNPIPLFGETAEMFVAMGAPPVLSFVAYAGLFANEALVALLIVLASLILPCIFVRTLRVAEQLRK